MKLKVSIEASSGSGYHLELHEDPPPDFITRFRVKLDELNYYSESEGDVLLIVRNQELTSEIVSQDDARAFELTFSGTVEVEIDESQVEEFRSIGTDYGVDYCLMLEHEDGEQSLGSGDDWEFLQNHNLVPEFPDPSPGLSAEQVPPTFDDLKSIIAKGLSGWESVDVRGFSDALAAWYQELDRVRRDDHSNLESSDASDVRSGIEATIERIEMLFERDC